MPTRPLSPGTLLLGRYGTTLTAVADRMGVSRHTISLWLKGAHPAPESLFDAIEALGGPDAASTARRHVDRMREAAYDF